MSWEAGLAVDHFEIMETGATEATSRVISSTEAAAGEAWVENLKSFTEYTITIYNGNNPRGSQTVTIPGLEIESTISDITANSAVFSWEETVDVDEYACVLSTEGDLNQEPNYHQQILLHIRWQSQVWLPVRNIRLMLSQTALYVLVSPLQLRKVNRRLY